MKPRYSLLIVSVGLLSFSAMVAGIFWAFRHVALSVSLPPPPPTNQVTAAPELAVSLREGFAFHRKGQYSNAITAFEAVIRSDPQNSDAYHGLAQALREGGNPSGAVAQHDRAINLDPDRHDLYWERGATYLRMKNYNAAIEDFKVCLEKNSAFPNAHLGLGEAYRAQGDFKTSLAHLDEAIAMKPDSAWFYRERGNTYRSMGDLQKAEADQAKSRELEQKPKV